MRLSRFKRASDVSPIQLTGRDTEIIRQVHRHRFLRSSHIVALVGGSDQQVLRRLQLLYHHGYLERPRAQLRYYERGASREIAYGLGNQGGKLLAQERGLIVDSHVWNEKNHYIGRVYLDHALLVSDVMIAIEQACRKHGGVRLLGLDDLGLPTKRGRFRWQVRLRSGQKLGVMPDRVFALEYPDINGRSRRIYYFLEADRGTMPVVRANLSQTSFQRKLIAYQATWSQGLHRRQLGIDRFRVLTVTAISKRVGSLVEACGQLESGHALFLFANKSILSGNILFDKCHTGKQSETSHLLDL
jgi:Replication-relaxation